MDRFLTLTYSTLLILGVSACVSVPEVENKLQALQLHSNMYVVQAGETVDTVSFRYAMTREQLVALNPGIETNIAPGLRINVRPGTQLSADIRQRVKYAPAATPLSNAVSGPAASEVAVTGASTAIELKPAGAESVQPEAALGIADAAPIVISENANGLREEIIPDTLDFEPVTAGKTALDDDLLAMVGEWTWPLDGQIAREFAPEKPGGQGVDIAGVPGQDIRAARGGTVVYSGRALDGRGDNLIIVRHPDNLMTTYAHTDNLFVAEDDIVGAGDTIASLGANVDSESVLRFEVRQGGNPLDPMNFLPKQ